MNVVTLLTQPAAEDTLRGRAVFVFTDVVGSTALAETLGDAAWADALRGHNRAIRRELAAAGGEEIAFLGDGFLVMFADAGPALAFARRVLRAVTLELRIGLHCGDAYREGRDVFGRAVHVAARVADQADAGEIAVSDTCRDLVDGDAPRFWRAREVALKGLPGRHRVWLTRPATRLAPITG